MTSPTVSPARSEGRRPGARHEPEGRRRLQGTLLNVHLYRRQAVAPPGVVAPAVVLFTADAGGDPKGVVRHVETQRSGITRVEVRDRQLLVNGRPIWIFGVNRHDHHPEHE